MADKKISQLTAASQVNSDAVFPLSQIVSGSDATVKATVGQVGDYIADEQTFAGLNTSAKDLIGAINEIAAGGGGGGTPKFKDFYTYGSSVSGTIKGAYVINGLWGADDDENFVQLSVDNQPLVYFDTSTNKIVRGDRIVSSNYFPNKRLDAVWHSSVTKGTVPSFTTASGTGSYSVNVADLGNYIYLRSTDIKDQNDNVVLPANCTLADLGLT